MLRPLGIGEMFDRSITLFVRNFLPFVAISAVLLVPLAVTRYVATDIQVNGATTVQTDTANTAPASGTVDARLALSGIVLILALGLMYLVWPFFTNAMAVGVAQQYYDRPVRFRDCYAVALRRWASILGAILLAGLAIAAWYLACAFVIVAALVGAVALAKVAPALAVALGIVIGLAVLALLLNLLVLIIVAAFAAYGASLESLGAFEAFRRAATRILNRREFGKALLIGLTVAVASIGGNMLAAAPLFVTLVFPAALIPAVVLESVLEVLLFALLTVLLAVYYFDVRVRREGLDLDASLQRLVALDVPA